MNFIGKILFTGVTYVQTMFSLFTDCNDTPNFGLYLVFLISLRCAGVVELSAFTCMSLTKILVVLRPDVYIALNSVLTVNFATIFIILVTFIDCSLRLKLYLIDNCEFDGLLYEIFRKDLCGPFDAHNHTNTITNISIIDKEPSCPSYPVISVMIIIILVLESVKFVVAFIKIIIIISKKLKIINSNCTNDNDIKEDVNKIDDLKTVKAQSDLEANTDKREENPEEMKPNPEPTKIQVISCATSNDEIDEKPSETVTDIATNKEIVQDSIRYVYCRKLEWGVKTILGHL